MARRSTGGWRGYPSLIAGALIAPPQFAPAQFAPAQFAPILVIVFLALMGRMGFGAEIYKLPVPTTDDHLEFPDRAASMRQLIPNQPLNPLLPDESRLSERMLLAQLPPPDWTIPAEPGQSVVPSTEPGFSDPGLTDRGLMGGFGNTADGARIRVLPRGGGETNLRMIPNGESERAWVINTPTQITVSGPTGPVELSADRIVVWTDQNVMSINNLGASRVPVEFYMEGNIEFRQGGYLGIAERMYYNVAQQTGVILEGELYGEARQQPGVYLEDFRTPFRLKGDVLQQLSPTLIQANNASFTTSRMGVPRYWIESDTLTLDTGNTSLIDSVTQGLSTGNGLSPGQVSLPSAYGPSGAGLSPDQNPQNQGMLGALSRFDRLQVTSENSRLYVGGVPIFNWPSFTADLAQNPSLYLDRIQVGSDSVFGTQLLTRWNNFQLFGITPQAGTEWTSTLDYLTDRGLGFGTDFDYDRDNFFGRPAISRGYFHSWFINDKGFDNLGFDRRNVEPEEDFRGRIDGKHMHLTPSGLQVIGELGWISDRNFLEQYFEEEFDLEKDKDTRLEIKQHTGSGSWSIGGNLRLNDFFTQTEWLPRADHYELGRSLFDNRLTWYEHSQIGYGRLRVAEPPVNDVDLAKFDLLAWEREVEGIRAVTRQELDMPLQLGPMKVVPYVLGEVAHWQEDLNGDDVTRLLGQAGVRSSMLFWRADPTVRNELFNINGMAHKIVLESEFLWADANQDYLDLPLYDALDDDSVEFFRRRFLFDTFLLGVGDDVPLKFDERTFAFRSGMQRSVAAPSTEIADDLMMFRLGLRQRIQTKRGLPGRERIVDWLTFDVESTLFPRADRDNFGQEIGPTTYDLRWHVGDRTTLMSDGYFDFFGDGLRTVSLGAALTRPGRSQYFVGLRSIEGPISANVLTSSIAYRLSPKWKIEYGSSVDFSSTGNIGQSGRIVRIGESLLVGLGAYYDASRNNFGFRFDIAPRFIRSKLGMIGGRPIAPVGAFGLE